MKVLIQYLETIRFQKRLDESAVVDVARLIDQRPVLLNLGLLMLAAETPAVHHFAAFITKKFAADDADTDRLPDVMRIASLVLSTFEQGAAMRTEVAVRRNLLTAPRTRNVFDAIQIFSNADP